MAAWLVVSAAVAALAVLFGPRLAPGAGLGIAAGVLYGAGDVATKGAVFGGAWLLLVRSCSRPTAARSSRCNSRSSAEAHSHTAGTASLLTNALPIAAGLALFDERVPGGPLGVARIVSFGCVVLAASMLARGSTDEPRESSNHRRKVQDATAVTAEA